MKKIIIILIGICLLLTGCNTKTDNNQSNNNKEVNTKKVDHKIYKYMKVETDVASNLYYQSYQLFGDLSSVSHGDTYYKPTLLIEFDTNTGKATKVLFYSFFLDYEDDEWVNKAIDKYNESGSDAKEKVTNVKKGRVYDGVSYLEASIDVNSHGFNQYISTYLIDEQDIDKYKDRIFFSRLYNYSTEPEHKEGDNYFEESLEGIRIEWSDSEIKAY